MDDNQVFPDDSVDKALAANAPPPVGPLRQAVLRRTTRVLRRRRWFRRGGLIAALAACYLAGLLTTRLGTPLVEDRRVAVPQVVAPVPPLASSPSQPEKAAEPSDPLAGLAAVDLEWRALEGQGKRSELYRLAGDRYLKEDNDVESALRCYRLALDTGSQQDLPIAPEDSWLLMAAKEARQKENRHANNGS